MYSAKQRDDFRHLFTKEYKHLYYYSLQITRQPEASKDIVSEVFARVWEHWADWQQENMGSVCKHGDLTILKKMLIFAPCKENQ